MQVNKLDRLFNITFNLTRLIQNVISYLLLTESFFN